MLIQVLAVDAKMSRWYTSNLEEFYSGNHEKLEAIMYSNICKLIPRLKHE